MSRPQGHIDTCQCYGCLDPSVATIATLRARVAELEAEWDRMRPVVSAAVSLARDRGALFDVEEAVDEYLACKLPPAGWACSRGHGHEGPCAASPVTP